MFYLRGKIAEVFSNAVALFDVLLNKNGYSSANENCNGSSFQSTGLILLNSFFSAAGNTVAFSSTRSVPFR